MKPATLASAVMLAAFSAHALAADSESPSVAAPAPWPGTAPADCPYPESDRFKGLQFTGRHAEYTGADTWYFSWAADGNLYSPWTDGNVNGIDSSSGGENATTGHATILGDDPLHLKVSGEAIFKSSPRPYEGRYPCGSLVHDGIWYYGTYCLHPGGGIRRDDGITYNWPWLGPFVGFRISKDFGKSWTESPRTPAEPLFGEHALNGAPVKIGAPHFVDFGKAMEHSPDGKAYLVGHGSSDAKNRRFAYNSWITADQAYLTRVTPGIDKMNDVSKFISSDGKTFWLCYSANFSSGWGGITFKALPPGSRYAMCFQEVRLLTPADSVDCAKKPTHLDPTPE